MSSTSGSSAATTTVTTTPVVPPVFAASSWPAGRRGPRHPRRALLGAGALCSAASRTSSATSNKTNRTSSTVAPVRDRDVPLAAGPGRSPPRCRPRRPPAGSPWPPTRAARSARRSSSGLSTSVSVLVWLGEARMAVKADSTPARVQATVEVRRTHTPDSRADSVFSADGPHGQAPGREPDEAGQAEGHDGRHDEGDDLSRGEEEGPDVKRPVDGHREGTEELLRPDEGQGGEEEQHLGQADGGHHDHDARPVEQAAQQQLRQRPDRRGQRQGERPARPSS